MVSEKGVCRVCRVCRVCLKNARSREPLEVRVEHQVLQSGHNVVGEHPGELTFFMNSLVCLASFSKRYTFPVSRCFVVKDSITARARTFPSVARGHGHEPRIGTRTLVI